MKPERRLELLEVVYWTCPNPAHKHRTLAVAQACCRKPPIKLQYVNRWTHDALAEIGRKAEGGVSAADLAAQYGVTISRMNAILVKWRKHVALVGAADELRERMKGGKHGV